MSRIKAGDLRTHIDLLAPVSTINARGRRETSWAEPITVAAGKSDVSGREFYEAQAYNAEDVVTFTIRYRTDVNATWRARHGEVLYNIVEVNHLGYMGDFLRLKCRAVAGGGN